jgi:hypothetical protein
MDVVNDLKKDAQQAQSWLKQHERIVIIVLALLFSYLVLYKGLGIVSQWENHRAEAAQAVVAAQAAKNASDLTQAKQLLSDYQTALTNATTANQTLSQAIATRNTVVIKQQAVDATLPPSDLANRWTGLIQTNGVEVTPTGINVSNTAAVATVQKLESLPVLQQNLIDEQTKEVNDQIALGKANDLIAQGKIVVTGLQTQLTDQEKSCTISLNAEKAAARKGKMKWFGIGYVAGLATRGILTSFGF